MYVQVTVGNKDNQSYLVVFDGSVLLSKIVRFASLHITILTVLVIGVVC